MIKSNFLRRVLAILLATLVFSALLNVLFYTVFSQQALVDIETNKLLPKAVFIADQYLEYQDRHQLSFYQFRKFINTKGLWDAEVMVLSRQASTPVAMSANFFGDPNDENLSDEPNAELDAAIQSVLHGKSDSYTNTFNRSGTRYLIIGIPIRSDQQVVGGVFMSKPLVEINSSMRSLNASVFLSLAIAAVVMLFPMYLASRQLFKPLRQVRDVALSMAEGDFDVRANQLQKGEFGQLGQTLNYLAERLSLTTFDLILERNRLQQTLDGLSEVIIAMDMAGVITHANPAIFRLLQLSDGDTAAIENMLRHLGLWDTFRAAMMANQPLNRTLQRNNAIFSISLSILDDDAGDIAGAVAMFRDITASERLEQMRRDYVANVSHEMRTPLTALRGLVEPLRDGLVKTEDDRQRYYAIILRETLRLSRLIDDMLELSRLQSGSASLECYIFSLGIPLEGIADKYVALAEETGRKFTMELPDGTPPQVYSNADRLEQVLTVLLDNAFKYTNEDGSIILRATYLKHHAEITVQDNGPGIPDEDAPHVFERFYKSDKSRGSVGTGLGLAIAMEIMLHLHENIWYEPAPGTGASFILTVQYAADTPALPPVVSPEAKDT